MCHRHCNPALASSNATLPPTCVHVQVGQGGMEAARDLALEMQARGEGTVLDQFNNPDNALAHTRTTGKGRRQMRNLP